MRLEDRSDGNGLTNKEFKLHIQRFMRDNPDWREKLADKPYSLKISEDKDRKLALFSYILHESDFAEPIVHEARGVVINTETFEVVKLAFYKFFNAVEPEADEIDWESASGSLKIDGSIVTLFWYEDKWNISTSGTIDASKALLGSASTYKSFGDMFWDAANKSGLDVNKLDKDKMYTFELVSPHNIIVIRYDKTELYQLSVRDSNTLEEIEYDTGVQKPTKYNVNSLEECRLIVDAFGDDKEGMVVKDKFNRRIKVKASEYIRRHYLTGDNTLTIYNALNVIIKGEQSEFLGYLPEAKDYLDFIEEQYNNVFKLIEEKREKFESLNFTTKREAHEWIMQNDKEYIQLYRAFDKNNLEGFLKKLSCSNDAFIKEGIEHVTEIRRNLIENNLTRVRCAKDWAMEHDKKFYKLYAYVMHDKVEVWVRKKQREGLRAFVKYFGITDEGFNKARLLKDHNTSYMEEEKDND